MGPIPLVQPVERVRAVGKVPSSRYAFADNLKLLLVIGVIVGHATMAWTENEVWVLEEPRSATRSTRCSTSQRSSAS